MEMYFLPSHTLNMAPQSRGRAPSRTTPSHPFNPSYPTIQDEQTPQTLQLQYESEDPDESSTLELASSPDASSSSEPEDEDGEERTRPPFLHHSNSSFLMANAFAPPYYNRPPTPLPASPSLTSLLRPPFSTTTSRPTTPDSSENDTPNDTEAAVAKSARTATTVPRASPKVPTYEYYGFVLYLLSSMVFCTSFAFLDNLKTDSTQ